jgi:glycosyltransferase involved in cell wall biosynthesis
MFSDSALPVLNGVSVSIDALVKALRERGHSVSVFTASHFGYRDPDPSTYRFPAVATPWTKGYPLAFPPFYPMLRHFRRGRFDVVHTHTPWTLGFVGLRWAQSHGIPIVATYHTLYHKYLHNVPFLPREYVRYRIAKHTCFYYNSVDQVITPSEDARHELDRHRVRTPVTVIPTGVPGSRPLDRTEARQRLGMGPQRRVLLYVGRIAKEKNLATLLVACAIAFKRDPTLVLWLVGDGPARSNCASMARNLGIADRVRFQGFVPRAEVDPYYAAADLFVFPSVTETQGLVVAEAMTYGLPAIVVAGGGASAAVEDGVNGLIVDNDPEAFAAKISELLADDGLYAALSSAATRAVRAYSIDQMAEAVLGVYAAALGGGVAQTPRPDRSPAL